jgi:tRNA threonylcarbamoyladenosine biosynthesis protein TsaE
LARGILRGLGHEGDVGSPTFPIVQTYEPPDTRLPAWHVDLYRIEAASELDELGLDDAREEGRSADRMAGASALALAGVAEAHAGDDWKRRACLDSRGAARLGSRWPPR